MEEERGRLGWENNRSSRGTGLQFVPLLTPLGPFTLLPLRTVMTVWAWLVVKVGLHPGCRPTPPPKPFIPLSVRPSHLYNRLG